MLAKKILMISLILLFGCESYKKRNYLGNSPVSNGNKSGGGGGTGTGTGSGPSVPTEKSTELILATDKLKANPGPYKAVIKYNNSTLENEFTPTGSDVRIPLQGLAANVSGIMSVELFQDGQMKFVAKRANTKLDKGLSNQVVIDNCLILPVPWFGALHDGSCEWEVADK